MFHKQFTLEESLSITTGRCDLTIALMLGKCIKNINMIVNRSILVSHYPKPLGGQPQRFFLCIFLARVAMAGCNGQAFFWCQRTIDSYFVS